MTLTKVKSLPDIGGNENRLYFDFDISEALAELKAKAKWKCNNCGKVQHHKRELCERCLHRVAGFIKYDDIDSCFPAFKDNKGEARR